MEDFGEQQNRRKQALEWWRGMELDEKKATVAKHHPDKHFMIIATSSMRIEGMWRREQRDG